jgi:hypothetical protein
MCVCTKQDHDQYSDQSYALSQLPYILSVKREVRSSLIILVIRRSYLCYVLACIKGIWHIQATRRDPPWVGHFSYRKVLIETSYLNPMPTQRYRRHVETGETTSRLCVKLLCLAATHLCQEPSYSTVETMYQSSLHKNVRQSPFLVGILAAFARNPPKDIYRVLQLRTNKVVQTSVIPIEISGMALRYP